MGSRQYETWGQDVFLSLWLKVGNIEYFMAVGKIQ